MDEESFMKVNKYGTEVWRNKECTIHRKNGPAVIHTNGHKEWRINGALHREDGPAIIYSNGDRLWYINDSLHREDGPAIELHGGAKEWFINNKCYRTKEDWFDALSDEAKAKCLFSEDFLNE
jgi:hypothetical protein